MLPDHRNISSIPEAKRVKVNEVLNELDALESMWKTWVKTETNANLCCKNPNTKLEVMNFDCYNKLSPNLLALIYSPSAHAGSPFDNKTMKELIIPALGSSLIVVVEFKPLYYSNNDDFEWDQLRIIVNNPDHFITRNYRERLIKFMQLKQILSHNEVLYVGGPDAKIATRSLFRNFKKSTVDNSLFYSDNMEQAVYICDNIFLCAGWLGRICTRWKSTW